MERNEIIPNAIILAAGKSSRFAPFTYEKPKGLFRVKGEILIERQIKQLHEAGIEKIYVVVGYMKEKFFYLEQKYGVKLVVNNEFGKKGNLYSMYVVKDYLSNTFVCCADHYYVSNPFMDKNEENKSYRACAYQTGKFREFAVQYSDADVITDVEIGGSDSLAMVGYAYFNEKFSSLFRSFMENEISDFGTASMFWEAFFAKHIKELTLYKKEYGAQDILEFDSVEDLRNFDSDFFVNVDSDIISNITSTLFCNPNDIKDIAVINAGLTNISFGFDVGDTKFVYRHPGGTAENLINRQTELFAQTSARDIGIDKSFIKMTLDGWKISYFVKDAKNCDFENNRDQLAVGMEYLHKLHSVEVPEAAGVKVFDNVVEGKKLMKIASATKGNLKKEFAEVIEKVDRLYPLVQKDAERLGYGLVLCHNDTYEPNYLYDKNGEIFRLFLNSGMAVFLV